MKKSFLSILLVGLLLGLAPLATAKDAPVAAAAEVGLKPVAVVSISGYDRVMSDIAFIGQIAQRPGLEKQAEGMLMVFAQGLNGLDKTRPWGLVVSTDGTTFPRLGFLPVTDIKQLLASIQQWTGPADDAGNGVLALQASNMKIYVKEQNGWAFISDSSETLADLPKDPTKLLDGLDKKFEIGVQIRLANVPEMFRTMAIDQLKEGIQASLKQQPREDDATFEQRQKLTQTQIKSLEDLINDADQFTLGWAIDSSVKSTFLDFTMTAKPNTNLAKKMAGFKLTPSSYSGFSVPKAAVAAGFAQTVTKEDIEQTNLMCETLKTGVEREIDKSTDLPDDATKAAAKSIVADLVEALKSTVAGGKADGGISLLLGSKTLTGIGGINVGDPARVESALKKISELAAKDPNIPKIKFNSDKQGDVRFHTAQLPVPPGEDIAKVIGSTLDVAIGIGPKSVYFGLGTDVVASLKKAIDKSKADASKPIAPLLVDISAESIIEFANAMEPNPLNQALATELAKTPGKDHIQIASKPVANGVTTHVEVQEAVLRLIGAAAQLQAGGGRPPGGPGAGPGRVAPPRRTN